MSKSVSSLWFLVSSEENINHRQKYMDIFSSSYNFFGVIYSWKSCPENIELNKKMIYQFGDAMLYINHLFLLI